MLLIGKPMGRSIMISWQNTIRISRIQQTRRLSTFSILLALDYMCTHAHTAEHTHLHQFKLNLHSFMVQLLATRPSFRAFLLHSWIKTGLLRVIWNKMVFIHMRDMPHSSVCHDWSRSYIHTCDMTHFKTWENQYFKIHQIYYLSIVELLPTLILHCHSQKKNQIHHQSSPRLHPWVGIRTLDLCIHMYICMHIRSVCNEIEHFKYHSIYTCILLKIHTHIHIQIYIHVHAYFLYTCTYLKLNFCICSCLGRWPWRWV